LKSSSSVKDVNTNGHPVKKKFVFALNVNRLTGIERGKMETKKCSKCGEVKSINKFHKNKSSKDRHSQWCKICNYEYYKKNADRIKLKTKKWAENNLNRVKEARRTFKENNPNYMKEYNREYYKKNLEKFKKYYENTYKNNPDYFKKQNKKWDKNNPERRLELTKNWQKNNSEKHKTQQRGYQKKRMLNIKFRISSRISIAIWESLKGNKNGRHWENLVGYNLKDLMIHLEKLFKPDMSWNNYGRKGWSIDHIQPISSFNFTSYNDREFKQCWALSNLQPLWHRDNIIKGNNIIKNYINRFWYENYYKW